MYFVDLDAVRLADTIVYQSVSTDVLIVVESDPAANATSGVSDSLQVDTSVHITSIVGSSANVVSYVTEEEGNRLLSEAGALKAVKVS